VRVPDKREISEQEDTCQDGDEEAPADEDQVQHSDRSNRLS
jgi:hypothetical protein